MKRHARFLLSAGSLLQKKIDDWYLSACGGDCEFATFMQEADKIYDLLSDRVFESRALSGVHEDDEATKAMEAMEKYDDARHDLIVRKWKS